MLTGSQAKIKFMFHSVSFNKLKNLMLIKVKKKGYDEYSYDLHSYISFAGSSRN